MRKLVRRSMSPGSGASPDKKELSPELQEELAAKRILRRKVLEFWSKGAHGYTLRDLSSTRTVNLSSCSLTDDDGEALASQLTKEMVQIRELDLSTNKLHDKSLYALSTAMSRGAVPCIVHLDLSHNAISDKGVKALVEAVTEHGALARLEKLLLAHNAITSDGISAIADAASQGALTPLLTLSVAGNALGDRGIQALASAASDDEVLAKLSELDISETSVSEKGLSALAEILLPKTGGLPCLRTLLVDEGATENAKLREVYSARTGHGGVHACKIQSVGGLKSCKAPTM